MGQNPEGVQDGDLLHWYMWIKQEFFSLFEKLLKESFDAKHLKAGFYKAGLCPLTAENISKSSFTPSLPSTIPPHKSQTPEKVDQDVGADTDSHVVHVQDRCCKCCSEATDTSLSLPLVVFCTLPWQEDNGKKKDSTQENEDFVLRGSTHC